MFVALGLLGHLRTLWGFRIVANRFLSDGKMSFTNRSGRRSVFVSVALAADLLLLFNGAKKYFSVGFSIDIAPFSSFLSGCMLSFSDNVGGGGSGNELQCSKEIS